MVRIEKEETEEEVPNSNPSEPSSSSSHRNPDEGFETASDGELGDTDDDDAVRHQSQSQHLEKTQIDDDALKQVSFSF